MNSREFSKFRNWRETRKFEFRRYYADGEDAYAMKRDLVAVAQEKGIQPADREVGLSIDFRFERCARRLPHTFQTPPTHFH